jgi:nucleotide-binding universal stress UspA family protein
MFHRIILAVDLAESVAAPKGLSQALELARASGGQLRLVNVQPLLPATFMEYVPADFDQEQESRAREALEAQWRADLIAVGSHRPVMSDYLLGSNAKTIVRHALCSVLVVRE